MGKLIRSTVVGAALALVVAGGAFAKPKAVRVGNLVLIHDGGISPTDLPRRGQAPVDASIRASIATGDGSHLPVAREAVIDLDKSVHVNAKGLPVCTRKQLDSRDTVAAKRACRGAIVGSGIARVEIAFRTGAGDGHQRARPLRRHPRPAQPPAPLHPPRPAGFLICRSGTVRGYHGAMDGKVPGGVVHELPADLREALIAKSTVLETWEDITPLARNEFICWVEDAKQEKTRERRIRRTREELEEGQRRPCCWPGCKHRERNGR